MSATQTPIFQSALNRGLSIIPIPPKEKGTKLERWPERAVNSANIMDGLPEHNYGVVANHDFCILDIDDTEKFYADIKVNLPLTYTVKTSRGRHLYFRHTEKSRRLGNKSAGIFDFQAFNKYVVGEGSTHPSGYVYECINPLPIAEIPDALVDALDQYVGERKERRLLLGEKAGDRQDMLNYAGSIYTAEITEEEMLGKLIERNETHSEEPLSLGDLQRMVQSAFKSWEHATPTSTARVTLGQPSEDWSLENFGSIESQPVRWLWKDYLALGKLTTVNGEPGSGKSLILLDTAARLTTGQDWADKAENTFPPSDVLLLTLEEDAADTIKPRFMAAGGDPRRLYRLAVRGRAAFFKIEEDREKLVKVFREHSIKLVVLDPMIDFVAAEQNKDADVREVLNQIVDLAQEFEFSVAGINHLNKKSDLAAMHRVSGARGWTSVARINYLVGKGENEVDGVGLRHICPLKLNLSADDRGSLDFTITTKAVTDGKLIAAPMACVGWRGRGEASADDITIAKPGKASAVEAWLRDFLKGGTWIPAKDIHSAAESLTEFSPDQIKRGLGKIGADWRRTATVPSVTEWRLEAVSARSAQSGAEGA